MKQIIKILEEMGIALTPAQKKELTEKGSDQMRSAADYTALEQQLAALRQQMEEQQNAHNRQLSRMKLDGQLAQLVTEAGGRSLPAVKALLDMDRFLESKEPQQELKEAVEQLRQQQSWLFRQERNPAPPLPGKPAKAEPGDLEQWRQGAGLQ